MKSSIVTSPLAARTMIIARMFSCRNEKNPAVFAVDAVEVWV